MSAADDEQGSSGTTPPEDVVDAAGAIPSGAAPPAEPADVGTDPQDARDATSDAATPGAAPVDEIPVSPPPGDEPPAAYAPPLTEATAPIGTPRSKLRGAGTTGTHESPAAEQARTFARAAANRTGEGARVVGDRVSQAATATAQALRETDVQDIADSTTRLIETARPFFLAAFGVLFTFLAWLIDDSAVGVVFAIGAILSVLGAAFSFEIERGVRRGRDERR